MISHATDHVSRAWPFRFKPRLPRLRTSVIVLFGALLAASLVGWARLQLPEPTGAYGVGRYRAVWTDVNRSETHLPSGAANRSVPVEVWYPAEEGTGTSSAYIDDLGLIREQLIDKGELSPAVVWGLSLVRTASRAEAKPILSDGLPLLILSPGNQTNVVFYSALAEDLASQGYVVVGIDHPYQVAAVSLPDGSVAGYDSASDGFSEDGAVAKVEERVKDIDFVLGQILAAPADSLIAAIDPNQIGVFGHSLGGLAAMETCRSNEIVRACLNIDGQGAGGPFGVFFEDRAPIQPVMFITKETLIHPDLVTRFEEAGSGAFRAVLPSAGHGDFTDGALLASALNPMAAAGDVVDVSRGLIGAFFDQALAEESDWDFRGLDAKTNVFINVFPLGGQPQIPEA